MVSKAISNSNNSSNRWEVMVLVVAKVVVAMEVMVVTADMVEGVVVDEEGGSRITKRLGVGWRM